MLMKKSSRYKILVSFNFILFFIVTHKNVIGQNISKTKSNIEIIGKYHEGSLLLRWAPAKSWLFEYGLKTGYKLEKAEFTNPDFKKLNFKPVNSFNGIIKPYAKEGLESKVDTTEPYQMSAVGILFDNAADSILKMSPKILPSPGEIAKRNAIFKNRQMIGLLTADLSFKASEILGLGYRDNDVESEKMYVYRLSVVNTIDNVKPDTLYLQIMAVKNPEFPGVYLTGEEKEKVVFVKWPKVDELNQYTGFFVEKSLNKKDFTPVNKLPYKPLSTIDEKEAIIGRQDSAAYIDYMTYYTYLDSVNTNYKPQYYRVLGIDAFGLKSIISDTIKLQGRDLIPPSQVFSVEKKVLNQKELNLQWNNPNSDLTELKGIQIEKGFRIEKEIIYQVISGEKWLPPTTTNWIDKNRITSGSCYYRINVADTAGNVAYGLPTLFAIEDTIPPLNPEWYKVELDTTGTLKFWYPRSKSADANYYKFFYNNEENTEYSVFEAKGTSDTVYVVEGYPIRQLNKHLYVKMLTVDYAGNMSKPTAPIKVKIPDVIPPLTPTLQQSELRDKILYAKYEKSGSNDVLQYLLQRSVDNREWRTFQTLSASKISGTFIEINDTIKEHGVYQRVRVIAEDESLLQSSPSEFASGRVTGKDRSKPCKNATAKYDSKLNRVELNWSHDEASATRFSIYKKVNNGKSFFLGHTQNLGLFIDRDIREKGSYDYIIVANTKEKGDAIPTELSVNIN